jgi:anti-sigma factor RsiW
MNLMSAYIDGELTGAEMLAIRRHMHDCDDCAGEYESMRTVKQAIAALTTVVPRQDFAKSIMARLDEVQVPPYQRAADVLTRFVHGRLSPVAAALVASGVAMVLLTAGGIDGMAPSAATSAMVGARTSEVAFVRDLHQPTFALDTHPLAVASETEVDRPQMVFASLSK